MAANNHAVRLPEDGPARWSNGAGWYADQSNPVITGLSDEQANMLVEDVGFEHVEGDDPATADIGTDLSDEDGTPSDTVEEAATDEGETEPPFDPTEYTVTELEDELDSGDYSDAELDALAAAEEDGEARSGALDAIDEQRG